MAYLKRGSTPPLKGKGSRLSEKQLLFIDHYLACLSATEAIKLAGYKTKNPRQVGSDLLNHPLVSEEIKKRTADRRERLELTADYVIHKLVDIVESTEAGNPQAALRGLELLGKHLGLYKEKQEISGPDGSAIQYEQKMKEDHLALESAITRLASRGDNVIPLKKA